MSGRLLSESTLQFRSQSKAPWIANGLKMMTTAEGKSFAISLMAMKKFVNVRVYTAKTDYQKYVHESD